MDAQNLNQTPDNNGKKSLHVPSLVLGILSIPFAILFAIIGDILGIVGIVLATKNKEQFNATPGLVLSIIGLVVGVANGVWGALIMTGVL